MLLTVKKENLQPKGFYWCSVELCFHLSQEKRGFKNSCASIFLILKVQSHS